MFLQKSGKRGLVYGIIQRAQCIKCSLRNMLEWHESETCTYITTATNQWPRPPPVRRGEGRDLD